jgi:ATP-binding cassette, subfamily B, bacterial
MPLLEPLPPALAAKHPSGDGLAAAVASDLVLAGAFGQEWLVVDRERLCVYAPDGEEMRLRAEHPLSEIRDPAIDSLIGGAALLVTAGRERVELVRFTNGAADKFRRVNKHLSDVVAWHKAKAKGEPPKDYPKLEDDRDEDRKCPQCGLVLEKDSKVCAACVSKGRALMRLMGYLKPYWKVTVWIWVLMITSTGISLIPPFVTKPLVDVVLNNKSHEPLDFRLQLLGGLMLTLIVTQIGGQILGICRGRQLTWLSEKLMHDLRMQVYRHFQTLSLRFFEKRQTGALIARVTRDTESVEAVLIVGAQDLVINILTLIGISIVLFYMNWRLTLLILVPIPVVILLSRVFWKRVMGLWGRHWHYRQSLSAVVNDSLSGIRVVKAFAKEEQEIRRFDSRSENLRKAAVEAEYTWVTLFPILGFIASAGSLIVWYIGGREVISAGPEEFTLGALLVFIAYLGMFYAPLQWMSRITDYVARGITSSERVFEILDSRPDVKESENPVPMPRIEGRVVFEHVTFGYNKHKPAIKDVSIDIAPGEMIGLVGHSGAGKSTLINLICRLYDTDEGRVLIDGVDVRQIRQQDLRSQIGMVLQDTFLFNDTIAENIRYAKPDAALEEIIAAAKAANAHDFIVQKPDGYDTQVGERGQSISSGERQRVAIARAILHDPRILILDEATSSVDTDTEKQIQDAIARLIKGRTTFAIAHRLSTLRNATRLVVLKGGKIEEIGTHDELLNKKGGEFRRLVDIQREMSQMKAVQH